MPELPTHFPVGTVFQTGGRSPRTCTVTDRLTTTNLAGQVVAVHYVAAHQFMGQTVTDNAVVRTTIAKGLVSLPAAQ